MKPSDALRARVLAAAAAAPSPTRRHGRRLGAALLALSLAIAVAVVELAGGLAHGAGRPLGVTAAVAGGWLAISVVLTALLARRRGTPGSGLAPSSLGSNLARRSTLLLGAALATPLVCFAWMRVFYGSYEEPFSKIGYRCLAFTVVIAATPLVGFLLLRRGIEPRRPMAAGAVAGAACGAWAGVVVNLWCPLTNPAHALVGHITPLAVLISVGALLGHRLLGVRR